MASLNKVFVMGNLGQDPELKYTQNGTPVMSMSIATTEYRGETNGQAQQVTEWHRIVVWSKLAENCAKYLAKGRQILVEGRLQTRTWDKDGQKHYATEIVAQNVQFLGSGDKNQQQGAQQTQQNYQSQQQSAPPPSTPPSSDDIPF
jgi:single-strand DNA-binding protein